MSCAPLTCCSIGAATDCATTSALAPAKLVDTETWGGTTCGYCAIGRDRAARAPTRIMTSAMTVEKTGRSMKKLNMVSRSLRVDGSLPESHRCFDGPNVRQVSHGPSAVHLLAAAVEEAAA